MTTQTLSPDSLAAGLADCGYIAAPSLAMALYLGHALQKPLLVEGPPGVGKTEFAKATAQLFCLPLVRLQCYEGLDEQKALYEWKYGKQLLYTQILKDTLQDLIGHRPGLQDALARLKTFNDLFYSEDFLEPRPLLKALQEPQGCVLLIDEIDKADEEFEAFLLELLSDFQLSIPELGTVKATTPPLVFLTSNDTRELSDALRRRCLHVHIPFPDHALESSIVRRQLPGIDDQLREHLVGMVQRIRELPLRKQPAISETIEWAQALLILHADRLDRHWVETTLHVLLKHREDIDTVRTALNGLLAG